MPPGCSIFTVGAVSPFVEKSSTGEGFINSQSYKRAGVDIDAGNALVEAIKPLARTTARAGCVGGLGGFGALFDLKAAGFVDPVLVAGTDGVGTKLKVAQAVGRHDTIGIDLVAMCANDVVVQGAEPLFFLDYFATGRLDPERGREIVAGIAEGCRLAGCALIGGESAEMPGFYAGEDYDLAGFCVGAAERGSLLEPALVEAGDAVFGLASSGAHSNGYSLIRKIVAEAGLDYGGPAPFAPGRTLGEAIRTVLEEHGARGIEPAHTLGEALLAPTRIYVKACLAALKAGGVHGLAHITGGGLIENVPRVLPPGLAVEIDASAWELPPLFRWLAREGGLDAAELARTFNCGIGMVALGGEAVGQAFRAAGETVYRIGHVIEAPADAPRVELVGAEEAWRG